MVFGDNVRARKAARALPRTPTQEGEKERRQDHTPSHHRHSNPHINHHRHSTTTQPCHKDTTPNQQCCDSKHTEGWGDTKKKGRTKQRAGPNPNTGHHSTHTTPAIQHGHRANEKGDANISRGGHCHHTPPFNTMPPTTTTHPTIHNAPTHHHEQGRTVRGYPTTRTTQTDTHHHTPHT